MVVRYLGRSGQRTENTETSRREMVIAVDHDTLNSFLGTAVEDIGAAAFRIRWTMREVPCTSTRGSRQGSPHLKLFGKWSAGGVSRRRRDRMGYGAFGTSCAQRKPTFGSCSVGSPFVRNVERRR